MREMVDKRRPISILERNVEGASLSLFLFVLFQNLFSVSLFAKRRESLRMIEN